MMAYFCKKCECLFEIEKEVVKHAEVKGRYICCPACSSRRLGIATNYKKMMECNKGVHL